MQLAYAIIADEAEIAANNKVSLSGGEITEFHLPDFPAYPIQFAMVAKVTHDFAECGDGHVLRIDLTGDQPAAMVPHPKVTFTAEPTPTDGPFTMFVLNFPFVVFSAPGKFACNIFVDDIYLGSVPFHIHLLATDQQTASSE